MEDSPTQTAFRIEILEQGWLDAELVDDPHDPCSHGDVRLVIGGETIANGAKPRWYGIGAAALALLRTLDRDHVRSKAMPGIPDPDEVPGMTVARRLVPCGCAQTLIQFGCPIGIDWTVTHLPGSRVHLGDVVRYDSVSPDGMVEFPTVQVELSEDEYRRVVVDFAERAKEQFAGAVKEFVDDYDQSNYEEFWVEYDERLARALSSSVD